MNNIICKNKVKNKILFYSILVLIFIIFLFSNLLMFRLGKKNAYDECSNYLEIKSLGEISDKIIENDNLYIVYTFLLNIKNTGRSVEIFETDFIIKNFDKSRMDFDIYFRDEKNFFIENNETKSLILKAKKKFVELENNFLINDCLTLHYMNGREITKIQLSKLEITL